MISYLNPVKAVTDVIKGDGQESSEEAKQISVTKSCDSRSLRSKSCADYYRPTEYAGERNAIFQPALRKSGGIEIFL